MHNVWLAIVVSALIMLVAAYAVEMMMVVPLPD